MFERRLVLLEEVVPGSKGDGDAVDGVLPEGICPGQGRPFGHVREGEGDFLHVVVVRGFIDS